MSGFIEGVDRDQVSLFPDRLEDWIDEDHLVRVVDLFVDQFIWRALALSARRMRGPGGPATIPPFC